MSKLGSPHTCANSTSHSVRWDQGGKGRGGQAGASSPYTMGQHGSPGVRILNSNLAFQMVFQGRIEYI